MNAQHLQLHVAHHEIYTKKTVLFIGKNRQRSCIANFEATLSMRSSNASTRRHQCTLSVRFFPFSEATPNMRIYGQIRCHLPPIQDLGTGSPTNLVDRPSGNSVRSQTPNNQLPLEPVPLWELLLM
jgi:hypothetical protein